MDFRLTDHQRRLKQAVAEFAAQELSDSIKDGIADFEQQFHGEYWQAAKQLMPKAGERGWLGPSWPVQYGGRGSSPLDWIICYEEFSYWGVPGADMGTGGMSWIGPLLLSLGTEAQKSEHLPPLTAGTRFWCTAYSEPNSGSDMASLRSTAQRQGADYVINGQKVWTSGALVADWCWLLVKTTPQLPKHQGLSIMLVDMRSKGVTVSPLAAMTGTTPFAQLFFDNVRVPSGSLVGEENKGWNYVLAGLEYERASVAILMTGLVRRLIDELAGRRYPGRRAAGKLGQAQRRRLAELAIEAEVGRLFSYRASLQLFSGRPSNAESALAKLYTTELSQRAAQFAMEVAGISGQSAETGADPLTRRALTAYLSCMGNTILAGTSEIERNVIAQRGLHLPR